MSPRVKLPNCDYCGKTAQPSQIVRFMWKKQRKKLDLCPKCFNRIWTDHLKYVQIGLEPIVKSGYWDLGARPVDFKSYLEKWAKRVEEQL